MAKKNSRLTVEHLWKMKRQGGLTLSPDGSQAVASVTSYDMEDNKAQSSLWLLSTFGGEPRQLTTSGEKDGEPAWSPDGKWIAFVAKRTEDGKKDEEPQLYVIAPDGGEASRVTQLATGVAGIKWFPDSKKLAAITWVWPDLKGEKQQAEKLKARNESKVKAHVVEHAAYRYWDHWLSDGRVPHVITIDLASGKVKDLFEGTKYELKQADTAGYYYDIAPDGKEIVFSFDPAEEKRFDHEHHLVTLDLKSGKFRMLTDKSPLNHEHPAYSPDGKWIACITNNLKKSYIAQDKLTLIDRKTGKVTIHSAKWDRGVNAPVKWAADSQSVWFTAEDTARVHLFRFALDAKAPEIIGQGGTVTDFAVSGEHAVYVRNNMSTPPRIFAMDLVTGEEQPVEDFNGPVMAGIKLGKVEEFNIPGFNGDSTQMWVIYPPDFDPKKKWPLVHNIHGGPHSCWGDNFHFRWNNQTFAAQGYVVACVNYHGSSSFGQDWNESINEDWGRREHADVEAGTDFLLKQGYIDRNRLAATGGSYGGYMVAWMNSRNGAKKGGDRYKAYVCHAGCFDWVAMMSDDAYYWHPKELGAFYWDDMKKIESQNPRALVKPMQTPTLVIHGLLDYRVPDSQGLAYYNSLKAKGVDARLVFFPDENHWILKPQNSRLWYQEYFAWLKRYIGAGATRKS